MFEEQLKMLQEMTPIQKGELIKKFNDYARLMRESLAEKSIEKTKTGCAIIMLKNTNKTKELRKLLKDKRFLSVDIVDKTKES
jgi:hypothetical protein